MNNGTAAAQAMQQAQQDVFQMLTLQTAVLGYIDVFFMTGLFALILVPTALIMSGCGKLKMTWWPTAPTRLPPMIPRPARNQRDSRSIFRIIGMPMGWLII